MNLTRASALIWIRMLKRVQMPRSIFCSYFVVVPPGNPSFPLVSRCPQYHVGEVLEARVLHSEDASQKERSNLRFRLLELGVKSRLDENAAIDASADDEAAAPEMPWWGQRPPKKGEVHR